mmetsp:Transcript_70058/g.193808  ORF Transcript_70058/g.193808 Transcript_70058/m.193808 type:complete len:376 (-) Transcript_70058:285-1412(-)
MVGVGGPPAVLRQLRAHEGHGDPRCRNVCGVPGAHAAPGPRVAATLVAHLVHEVALLSSDHLQVLVVPAVVGAADLVVRAAEVLHDVRGLREAIVQRHGAPEPWEVPARAPVAAAVVAPPEGPLLLHDVEQTGVAPQRVKTQLEEPLRVLGSELGDEQRAWGRPSRAGRHLAADVWRQVVDAVEAQRIAPEVPQPDLRTCRGVLHHLALPPRECATPWCVARALVVNAAVAPLLPPVEIPQGVLLDSPVMQDHVDDDCEVQSMRGIDKGPQVVGSAERTMQGQQLAGVVAPEVAVLRYGHELHCGEACSHHVRQLLRCLLECALWCEASYVHLVDDVLLERWPQRRVLPRVRHCVVNEAPLAVIIHTARIRVSAQ